MPVVHKSCERRAATVVPAMLQTGVPGVRDVLTMFPSSQSSVTAWVCSQSLQVETNSCVGSAALGIQR